MLNEYKNVVGYSPSDFFYASVLNSSEGIDCRNIDLGNIDLGNINTGNINTGNINTGNINTGNINTGNINTGNINTGNINTGNINTGNINTGNINTGNINTGNINTGNTQIYQDVCLNQSLVKSWTDHKINHAGSRQSLNDSQSSFNVGVLNTINLVAGIGFIVWSFTSGWIYQ